MNAERYARIEKAEELLNALLQALADERNAVGRIDPDAMGEARLAKERLAGEIAALKATDVDNDLASAMGVRELAARVVYQTRANAVLLSDASMALASKLGLRTQSNGTYDRRGRGRVQTGSLYGRVF